MKEVHWLDRKPMEVYKSSVNEAGEPLYSVVGTSMFNFVEESQLDEIAKDFKFDGWKVIDEVEAIDK